MTRTRLIITVIGVIAGASFALLRIDHERESSTPAKQSAPVVAIAVENNKPVGGVKKIKTSQGQTVRLVITSDKNDEIHVHGYDLERSIGPAAPTRLTFAASLQGRYEIELHKSKEPIASLDVSPPVS